MNRLGSQTSPYLAQHADNPVDWYPWGPEALEAARAQNKPILLSIGYSACHWCHVMAHESFEDAATAALMNEYFVNVKVDREERPDLDRIYQTAHQILTRNRGGWPLTMFLAPEDHLPFFGGTYFPPESRHGLPGFRDVLRRVAEAYRARDREIGEFRAQMNRALADALGGGSAAALDEGLPARACASMASGFDPRHGGFGDAPRFPHPAGLGLLLNEAVRRPADPDAASNLEMFARTLTGMARGGLRDHLGGGFYRYSVDETWTIPHFEKMLYDNGPLLALYARSFALTGDALHAEAAVGIAAWALGEMRGPETAFYSSLDADSEGEEGRYYVWTREEVRNVLGEDYTDFAAAYGLDGPANFEGRWHLRLPADGLSGGTAACERLRAPCERLLVRRARRPRPGLDDKILCAWNALMITGLAEAGIALARGAYVDAAADALSYLRRVHYAGDRLLAASKRGHAHLNGYLDDYAFLLQAVLSLLAARWNRELLSFATTLADDMLARFEDAERGGFYFTAIDHEKLVQRSRTFSDDSLPSGNAVAASALLRLGQLLGEARYLDAADRTLRAAGGHVGQWPEAHAAMLVALADRDDPPPLVIVRAADDADLAPYLTPARRATSGRGAVYVIPSAERGLPGLLTARAPRPGADVTAYLCRGHTCSAPLTDPGEFAETLG